jgi:hypothetical protein
MKIATYNINGINGRLEILLRWLKEAQPDIVCLQELKSENYKFPESAIKEAGYQSIWHGQKSWNGVAILSKTETKSLHIADILKLLLTGLLSVVFICQMAILTPGQNLTISCAGSNVWRIMLRIWSTVICRLFLLGITM